MNVFRIGLPITAALLITLTGMIEGETIPFQSYTVAPSFDGAQFVRAADVDGDGDLDILAAAADADTISWFENTAGDGSAWVEDVVTSTFDGANCVGAADLDGDGDLDLFGTGSAAGEVRWYRNSFDGAVFSEDTVRASVTGANWVEAGDIDGDGDLDLVGVGSAEQGIFWWENDGTPFVGSWPEYTLITTLAGAWSATPVDMDHDGDLDILTTAILEDMVVWWENDGTPVDGGWIARVVSDTFDGAHGASSADLDGDGDLDVVAAALSGNAISWWESDGTPANGGWIEHTMTTNFTLAYSVSVADLDGDGDLDVFGTSAFDDEIKWWESDGTPANGGWIEHTVATSFDNAVSAHAADLDGDGDNDLVGAAHTDDDIVWWENETIHRRATFPPAGNLTIDADFSSDSPLSIYAADLDHDGDLDVVAAAPAESDIVWWESDGTPLDGGWTEHSVAGGTVDALSVTTADVDSDGDVDILSTSASAPGVAWWENDGTPAVGLWTLRTTGGNAARNIHVADFDEDGDPDLVLRSSGLDTCFWKENRDASVDSWSLRDSFGGTSCVVPPSAADLDGDGDPDVLAASSGPWIYAWENPGPPWVPNNWVIHLLIEETAHSVHPADVDGDGFVDIVALMPSQVMWWRNDGTPFDGGWVESLVSFNGTADSGTVLSADVDDDGDLDLLTATSPANTVIWWESDGSPLDGGWTSHVVEDFFEGAVTALAPDLDGDGSPDILGAAETAGEITWWENRGGQFAIETTNAAGWLFQDNVTEGMLKLEVAHRGRSGDLALELATIELLLEAQPGVPLTSTQANALAANIQIYLDDGSGIFNLGSDTHVATVDLLVLTDGVLRVPIPDGDVDAKVDWGTPRTYFVVATSMPDASSQSPNTLIVTHLTDETLNPAVSTAEDRDHDISLTMEWAADVPSTSLTFLTIGIFADGFESGNTSAWSNVVP